MVLMDGGMTMHRLLTGFLALTLAAPAAAQDVPLPGWLGIIVEEAWTLRDSECHLAVTVEDVYPGAPADRAGLRSGDVLLRIDGRDAVVGIEHLSASRPRAGDSVRFTVSRDGKVRELVAVAGTRPDRLPPRPVAEDRRVRTLVAPRSVFRVAPDSVIVCGEPFPARVAAGAPNTKGFLVIQARADSLRQVMARRALEARVAVDTIHQRVIVTGTTGVFSFRTREAAPEPPESPQVVWLNPEGVPLPDSLRVAFRLPPLPDEPTVEAIVRGVPGTLDLVHTSAFRRGTRAVAGAAFAELNEDLARYFRGAHRGLLVLQVVAGTPAARAGLRPGDVVIAGNGSPLRSVEELRALLARRTDRVLALDIIREGQRRALSLAWD